MTISMDEKAANAGDKLKHALLLEVLARCKAWESLTYAESHAGAGKYSAAEQAEDKPHIAELHKLVSAVAGNKPAADDAGGRYFHTLQEWWSDQSREDEYPGSVLQAARFLTDQKVKAEFRVTEADKETHDRLVKAVSGYGIEPKHAKFQEEIDWLTENDSLVLLLDPLWFGEDFGEDRDKELNEGGIDLPTLKEILAHCRNKSAAVVLLWLGFSNEAGHVKRGMAYGWLKCICDEQMGSLFSCYHTSHYYTFIIGFDKGKEVVDELRQIDWEKKQWLTRGKRPSKQMIRKGLALTNDRKPSERKA